MTAGAVSAGVGSEPTPGLRVQADVIPAFGGENGSLSRHARPTAGEKPPAGAGVSGRNPRRLGGDDPQV